MVEGVNQLDSDKITEADNTNSEEDSCGIPILFIDLDGGASDELKHDTYKYFKDIEKDNLL